MFSQKTLHLDIEIMPWLSWSSRKTFKFINILKWNAIGQVETVILIYDECIMYLCKSKTTVRHIWMKVEGALHLIGSINPMKFFNDISKHHLRMNIRNPKNE